MDQMRLLNSEDSFVRRHIGPSTTEIEQMLKALNYSSLEAFIDAAVPKQIRTVQSVSLPHGKTETETLDEARALAKKNQVFRSFIGMGYHDCVTPSVVQRNILENPGWYTQYTPYQAEIAQGRLEALLNFQTMVMDLTGFPIANASMLDEGTAAAEAMILCYAVGGKPREKGFFVSKLCHPQTIAVVRTRAEPLGIRVTVGKHQDDFKKEQFFGALLQYPATDGSVLDYRTFVEDAHSSGALVVAATDLLSLTLLKPPGEWGADVAVGNSQRLGVPYGYGGPHAAFFATKEEYKRVTPGRIVGISQDASGRPAYRLALQTREQHIRRDKATSNICTAQALLAIISSMYAVYHGPKGLKSIGSKVHDLARTLKTGLEKMGYQVGKDLFFDTVAVSVKDARAVISEAEALKMNLRKLDDSTITISLDETCSQSDIENIWNVFKSGASNQKILNFNELTAALPEPDFGNLSRSSPYLSQEVFNSHHSETEMLRYMHRLEARDLSLNTSMIPLGSCTMKLNATTEMLPVTWPEFAKIHPFAPLSQSLGYQELFGQLEKMLAEITGFYAVSLQPNAGSQGEYAGMLAINKYHQSRGQGHRKVCLIPRSAHGTNPATAAMVGMEVVVVECDRQGNIDVGDLKEKASQHSKDLSAIMVTYPSTHGVFEENIREVCQIVHQHGGQIYMDGANMNAQIGLCRPADLGADVCHLNLHKTFCIPHGGGGPGMGPIGVTKELAPFLPSHSVIPLGSEGCKPSGAVSAAPWGSSSILPISWSYIKMMGGDGLALATSIAILNANYLAKRLSSSYPLLFSGKHGLVAHECILDLRQFKDTCGIDVEDVAKRLMDYGFHAPTVSFPVAGTLMIEPTESESKEELDRFCDAMISIRAEISKIESGKADQKNNLLKGAPHTALEMSGAWDHPYSREEAAYPASYLKDYKYWTPVSRINNVLGDRNLICGCS